jgi:hypothetical protein
MSTSQYMYLHVLGLCQYLKQLVVGQEVESREAHSLHLQVILQVLPVDMRDTVVEAISGGN